MIQSSYLGIDVGGTNLKAALIDKKGSVIFDKESKTPRELKFFIDKVKKIVADAESIAQKKDLRIESIGVGIPGLVDYQAQKIIYCPNLKFLNNLGVEEFSLEIPIFLGNDVDLALLGIERKEKIEEESFIYLALGTGLGGAFKINDLYSMNLNLAGEIGHMKIVANGKECNCGARGCLEAYVSGWAIIKEGQKRISKEIKEAKEVFDLVRENHPEAEKIIKEMAEMLGVGAANLVNVLGIETIYLGGKIIKSADLFLESAEAAAQKNIFQAQQRNFSFKIPKLKEKAGLIGAAYWALKNSDSHKK